MSCTSIEVETASGCAAAHFFSGSPAVRNIFGHHSGHNAQAARGNRLSKPPIDHAAAEVQARRAQRPRLGPRAAQDEQTNQNRRTCVELVGLSAAYRKLEAATTALPACLRGASPAHGYRHRCTPDREPRSAFGHGMQMVIKQSHAHSREECASQQRTTGGVVDAPRARDPQIWSG